MFDLAYKSHLKVYDALLRELRDVLKEYPQDTREVMEVTKYIDSFLDMSVEEKACTFWCICVMADTHDVIWQILKFTAAVSNGRSPVRLWRDYYQCGSIL